MQRRIFIASLGAAACGWLPTIGAQQGLLPVIGYINAAGETDAQDLVTAFKQGLAEKGYVEGQNVSIEYRWAKDRYDQLGVIAQDLVGRHVAIIAATSTPVALAAKAATSTIPIVFTVGGDPVKIGLVASLNRPGGNATGVSLLTTVPEAKRLGLLHELVPNAALIGVLINPNYQGAEAQSREVQDAARAIDRPIEIAMAGNDRQLEAAFGTLVQQHADALLVGADPFFGTRRDRIIALAAQFKLPAMYQFRDYPVAGGLMSYGINITDGYRQVGVYTGQVLKGAKPADLPIHQSIKFEFIINLKSAKALGLQIPDKLIALADEVIE